MFKLLGALFKRKSVVERAIELAKTKHFGSLDDLLLHLSMEGYGLSKIDRAVKDHLRELMKQRRNG